MDKRRLVYAGIFLLICILLGYAIYRVFFYKPKPQIPTGTTSGQQGQFPAVGEGKTPGQITTGPSGLPSSGTRTTTPGMTTTDTTGQRPTGVVDTITDIKTKSASASKDGGARFYNEQDGHFYTIDSQGNARLLNDKVFYNVDKVTWSPANNESIVEYPDGANIYFNFDTGEQVTLPSHWEEFSFSGEGGQIAAKSMGLDQENRWLITSDPKGNNINLIEPMGENASKVIIDWSPARQVVALSATGEAQGSNRQEILLIGLNGENFRSLTIEGRGLQEQWSPEGDKLLHSVYSGRNDYKPELWITDATPDTVGENRRPLGVNTWANKCTMADDRYAYCGVPDSLETGAGFAPQMADNVPDKLFKIDTVTGIKTQISLEGLYTVDSIFTSEDGSTLYFTDKSQNGLFTIPLK